MPRAGHARRYTRPVFNLSAHTTDDRGRRVPVFTAAGVPAARFRADPHLRQIVVRVAHTAQPGLNEPIRPTHIAYFLPGALIPVMTVVLSRSFRGGVPPWIIAAATAGVMVLTIPVSLTVTNRLLAGRTRATLLLEGRCPSCAYTLAGLPVEPDGRITCPECSAAWKRDTLGAPTPVMGDHLDPRSAISAYTTRAGAVDALDRVVRLRDPLLRDLEPARAAELGPSRIQRIRADVNARTRARKVTSALACLLLWLFTAGAQLLIVFTVPVRTRQAWFVGMAALFTFAIAMVVYRIFTFRSRSTALPAAGILVRHRLCPSCAGDLTPSPDSPLLACTTCRAAWKPDGP